jgi:hypothetical protein
LDGNPINALESDSGKKGRFEDGLMAYQGDESRDADPETERNNVKGATRYDAIGNDATSSADVPQGGDESVIYLETLEDILRGLDLTAPLTIRFT